MSHNSVHQGKAAESGTFSALNTGIGQRKYDKTDGYSPATGAIAA